jgi:acyl-CoA reductase-like NAD-dependent aldehyde dehydrogenase
MVNQRQRAHVLEQIEDAVRKGAELRVGGEPAEGSYLGPTLLTGVADEMDIAVHETFGPVACVTRVADAEEAVLRANDTPFGLGAVVFGSDDQAERVARRLQAGMVGVNRACGGAPGTPWVGARESGFGFHKSRDGHRQFTQTRVVTSASS